MNSKVIIALDFQTKEEVFAFLEQFSNEKLYLKIGMELYYGLGNEIVAKIIRMGHQVFLDLKLHDIPNTVKSAMIQLSKLGVNMVNVHASGSIAMMKAAIEGLEEGKISSQRPQCIAVTCLTSLDQEVLEEELMIHHELEDVVVSWAKNAKEAGLDGIVCSPLESKIVHEKLGKDFITVTPGIRLESDQKDDQKRVTTPKMAREMTSSYIVVGRTITKSSNPVATYHEVLKQFQGE